MITTKKCQKIVIAAISIALAFCPTITTAQNWDNDHNQWGNSRGGQYNNGHQSGGWHRSHEGYNSTTRDYDNNTTTNQWGNRNYSSDYHQSGNCNTGNCSYSSSYESNSSSSSRTRTNRR
jgi:hypothetical protein